MNALSGFAAGLAAAALMGVVAAAYLRRHLRGILVDLCGTEARADFWLAFSNVAFVSIPVAEALNMGHGILRDGTLAFQLVEQLRWALMALILTVLGCAAVLARFIPRPTGGASEFLK